MEKSDFYKLIQVWFLQWRYFNIAVVFVFQDVHQ